jgi:hypothetical protein
MPSGNSGAIHAVFSFDTETFTFKTADYGETYVEKLENGWYRIGVTRNLPSTEAGSGWYYGLCSCASSTNGAETWDSTTVGPVRFYAWGAQFETTTAMTAFLGTGTRSNTQAVLDLTGRNTVTATSLTYNADRTFSFDGNTNFITTTTPLPIWNKSFTISQWVYFLDDSRAILVGDFGTVNAININFEKLGSRTLRLYWNATPDISTPANVVALLTWQYVTVVRNKTDSTVKFYVNDSLVHTYNGALVDLTATAPHRIGSDVRTGTTVMFGSIASTQIYNQALTQLEIQQNFNATKGRFGL